MTLENFKEAVEKQLLSNYHGNIIPVKRILAGQTEEDWQNYYQDFSNEPNGIAAVAYGITTGLI